MSLARKQETLIEEDKDFYLSFLNKKIRNTKKKLEQIDELLKKDPETLKAEQREKIDSRDEVLQTIKQHDDLKNLYYTAYKVSLEEGKATPKSKTSDKKSKTETQDPVEIALKKLLELFAFSQLAQNSSQDLSINQLKQFCNSTLNFTSPSSLTIEERIQQSLNQIQPYIKSEGEFELQGEKFSNLHESVRQALQQPVVTKEENITPTSNNSNKSNEIGLPPSAVTLQNPVQTTQKPHKVVRFVDEIENEFKSDKNKENETLEPRQPEEERQHSGEEQEQEQKSFRKRRNYDNQDKPKGKSNNNGAKNPKSQDNYHRGGGRNAGSKYQYTTTYYEKKSTENKN